MGGLEKIINGSLESTMKRNSSKLTSVTYPQPQVPLQAYSSSHQRRLLSAARDRSKWLVHREI
ncbi:hypothetical protein F2Q68_00012402 [Brassica cretica]|uniref:Uncharacterized protein n=1 Tax=Brassica cretica TaxID=69181 RepID=A0A8S9KTX4_BRACR|nr:hypothetical protein F2Q68_00012402 [Brassica cretica]